MMLKIDTETKGDTLEVVLSGEFDIGSVATFREAVDDDAKPCERIVIDMSDLAFMDSSGLQELVRLNNRARERGHELVLARPSMPVTRLLEMTGLEQHFTLSG